MVRVSGYFFVAALTITASIGAGIIALPARLSDSGFAPFLIVAILSYAAQMCAAYFIVDVLQYSMVEQRLKKAYGRRTGAESAFDEPSGDVGRGYLDENGIVLDEALQGLCVNYGPLGGVNEEGAGVGDFQELEAVEEASFGLTTKSEDASGDDAGHPVESSPNVRTALVAAGIDTETESAAHDLAGHTQPGDLGTPVGESPSGFGSASASQVAIPQVMFKCGDLHTVGRMFLSPLASKLFDFSVMFHYIAVLTSYALAGSATYGLLIGLNAEVVVPFFVGGFTAIILFGGSFVKAMVSGLTLIKGTLLVVMIFLVIFASRTVHNAYEDHWNKIMDPLLILSVALAGTINVVTVACQVIPYTPGHVRKLKRVVGGSITAVFVLNVLWSYSVLSVVPQGGGIGGVFEDLDADGHAVTLVGALETGTITTDVLVAILNRDHPEYGWLAGIVSAFVVFSVTVSFLALGLGMKHVLDGYATSVYNIIIKRRRRKRGSSSLVAAPAVDGVGDGHADGDGTDGAQVDVARHQDHSYQLRALDKTVHGTVYAAAFGAILILAWSNPESFFTVLERFASLAINFESGIFVIIMYVTASRRYCNGVDVIPNASSSRDWKIAAWVTMVYFVVVVLYDLVETASDLAS